MFLYFFFFLSFLLCNRSEACTGIVHQAENGDYVYARTLEFGKELATFNLLFVPRNIENKSMSNEKNTESWKNKYAYIGFNPFDMPVVADGLNEKGLSCGAFYFPGWAKYEKSKNDASTVISNLDFVSWVLGNFSTVDEVIEALKNTIVIDYVYEPWKIVPPLHYIVVDQKGNKIVIEYIDGERKIYNATLGTITNSPSYDWHEINARNYIGLNALNKPSVEIDGAQLSAFGQGSGAIGLPGDFTPPSRFIRATFLNQVTLRAKDGLSAVQRAFKILNQFDIPKGVVREKKGEEIIYEETQWTSAADLAHKRYFFHTEDSRVIKYVLLKDLDLNAKEIVSIPLNGKETFLNLSKKLSQ